VDTNWYRACLSSNSVTYKDKVVRVDAVMPWGGAKRHIIVTLALDKSNSSAYFWPQGWSPR
jgi:hypothetical protein